MLARSLPALVGCRAKLAASVLSLVAAGSCSSSTSSEPSGSQLVLEVSGGLVVEGPLGGPFPSTSLPVRLRNEGGSASHWSAQASADWLALTQAAGELAPGAEILLSLSIDGERASSLRAGTRSASVEFLDESASRSAGSVPVVLEITESGWTVFVESPDTRKVHVSSSLGDDANDGLSPEAPKRTIAAGKALLRSGFPDWLLLRSGDVFDEGFGQWRLSGRSAGERMLLSSYGEAPTRPFLRTGTQDGITGIAQGGSPASVDHLAIVGLHFRPHLYVGTGEPAGLSWLIESTDLLVEDCLFEAYQVNIAVVGAGGRKRDLRIRRNVIVDAFATSGTVGHGIYLANSDRVLIEENVLDHNGWNESVPGALPSIFRHGIYVQGGSSACTDVVARDNVIARSASHGLQLRPGGVVENNLFLRNSIGLLLGGGNEPNPGGVVVDCRRNVFLDAKNIDDANPRGWAIEAQNVASGTLAENVIAHRRGGNFPISIDLHASINGIGIFGAHLERNRIFDWGGSLQLQGNSAQLAGITLADNQLDDSLGSGPLLWHFNATTTSSLSSSGNRFFSSGAPPAAWINIAGTGHSVASWAALVGDPSSFAAPHAYPDPARTIESYDLLLGGAGTLESFLATARTQSRASWRPEYGARLANAYVRAGFGL